MTPQRSWYPPSFEGGWRWPPAPVLHLLAKWTSNSWQPLIAHYAACMAHTAHGPQVFFMICSSCILNFVNSTAHTFTLLEINNPQIHEEVQCT